MALDLVDDGSDGALIEHALQLEAVEVGGADGTGQASSQTLLHGLPRVDVVDVRVDDAALLVQRLQITALFEGHRRVHQVQVQVLDTQLFQ